MSTYSSNAGSMSGTIKGFLGPRKKNKKQYELDALRMEMEMLQERCSAAENNLSSASHDVNALRCDRDALQQQLRERTLELTTTRADATKAEEEVARLKTLHSQVKGALQGAYSQNQDLTKQISEVESLCGAQQASLEEAEERYRALADEQDALRHAGLTAKAQLVTAQAQVSELRGARDDLVERAAALEQRLAGARAELEGHVRSAREAAASKASLEVQMEGMLGRLRELEAEKQQLEARQILLQEENLDLGRQVEGLKDEGRGSEARLAALARDNAELAGQLDRALARVEALAADRQRSLAERDGLAAELRSSADMREALRARNDELAAEVVGLRHVASAKKGSPLRWRRGKAAADAPQVSASTEFGPMTKQRVLFTTKAPPPARTASAGSATGQQQQQQLALAGGGVRGATHSGEGEGDVTALVTAAPPGADESHAAACGGSGRLPAPLCSDSPELKGARGPLAAGRTAGGRTAAAAAAEDEAAAGHKDGAEGGEGGRGFMGGLGGLLACFAPPRTARPVAAA
ncbi:MAG: hypothetical protein J3K34DRAFT_292723 [Monoraphidium minutum]|nr:MAG: hypothetical protein J3K34DRAFT_292723 [Monoraphidium minutum]